MSYSIGGPNLTPVEDKSASYLSALSDATQNMNSNLKDLAKLPGDYLNYMQDNADARYVAALNKYSNDPTGLAKALQNGEIDTSNVRAETLGKTQDTLSNIQKTYSVGYLQNRLQNYYNYLDNPENAKALEAAQQAAYHGDTKTVNDYIANFNGPAELLAERISKFNPQSALDTQKGFALQGAGIALQRQALQDAQNSNLAIMSLEEQIVKMVPYDQRDEPAKVAQAFWEVYRRNPALVRAAALTPEGLKRLQAWSGTNLQTPASYTTDSQQLPPSTYGSSITENGGYTFSDGGTISLLPRNK